MHLAVTLIKNLNEHIIQQVNQHLCGHVSRHSSTEVYSYVVNLHLTQQIIQHPSEHITQHVWLKLFKLSPTAPGDEQPSACTVDLEQKHRPGLNPLAKATVKPEDKMTDTTTVNLTIKSTVI